MQITTTDLHMISITTHPQHTSSIAHSQHSLNTRPQDTLTTHIHITYTTHVNKTQDTLTTYIHNTSTHTHTCTQHTYTTRHIHTTDLGMVETQSSCLVKGQQDWDEELLVFVLQGQCKAVNDAEDENSMSKFWANQVACSLSPYFISNSLIFNWNFFTVIKYGVVQRWLGMETSEQRYFLVVLS